MGLLILVIMGSACCFAAGTFGSIFGILGAAEKTYYPECETLADAAKCQHCCQVNGHNGYTAGTFFQEGDQLCGCI